MKTYLVLILLLACTLGSAHAQGYNFDSLVHAEFYDTPNDHGLWKLNKELGMANFALADEWAWSMLVAGGTVDTSHNFTVTLVGHKDRQVGLAEFHTVFAADMSHDDTLLYNYRQLVMARSNRVDKPTVMFERAYETAYSRARSHAEIVAR